MRIEKEPKKSLKQSPGNVYANRSAKRYPGEEF